MTEHRLCIQPLIVGSAVAAILLGCGKAKFQKLVREDPDFPRPLVDSAPNKPQWATSSLAQYVEIRRARRAAEADLPSCT